MENGDAVDVIDTLTQKRIGRVPVGYAPQALVYIPNAVTMGEGKENLQPATQMPTLNIGLQSSKEDDKAVGHVTIRQLGELDGLEVMVRGLMPNQEYGLYLVGDRPLELITAWSTDKKGNGMGQALGSLRERLRKETQSRNTQQHLVIAPKNAQNPINTAILVQSESDH